MFYSYRTKMKYSFQNVVAMLSSVSLTSHVLKSSLQIRRTMAANCFSPRGSIKTMQMDGRGSHWVPADCVHAACKCMKHEAGPNLSQAGTGTLKHAALCRGLDFC